MWTNKKSGLFIDAMFLVSHVFLPTNASSLSCVVCLCGFNAWFGMYKHLFFRCWLYLFNNFVRSIDTFEWEFMQWKVLLCTFNNKQRTPTLAMPCIWKCITKHGITFMKSQWKKNYLIADRVHKRNKSNCFCPHTFCHRHWIAYMREGENIQ